MIPNLETKQNDETKFYEMKLAINYEMIVKYIEKKSVHQLK